MKAIIAWLQTYGMVLCVGISIGYVINELKIYLENKYSNKKYDKIMKG